MELITKLDTIVKRKYTIPATNKTYEVYAITDSKGNEWATGLKYIWDEYDIGSPVWIWKGNFLSNINGFANPSWNLRRNTR